MKLDDFLKPKKVRCINRDNRVYLTENKVYDVIGAIFGRLKIRNDNGDNIWYDMTCFELVIDSAENPIQGVELTPEFEAVERPMTLIEKLEQEVNRLLELKAQEKPHSLGYVFLGHHIAATVNAINIVKQHSDWISVDERLPPDNMMVLAYCNIRKTTGYAFVSQQQAWSFYHFTKNSENQALAMANDISKWMPTPKPPSEVQGD